MTLLASLSASAMPSALEAEQALLGAVLYENAALARITDPVTPESFGTAMHGRAWEIVTRLIGAGRLAEPTAIHARMSDDPDLMASGGLSYLLDLVEKAPPITQVADFAARVNEAARRREIIRIAGEAMQAARDPEREPFAVLTETEAALSALTVAAAPDGHTLVDARSAAVSLVARLDEEAESGVMHGTLVGLDCIDRQLGGIYPNELIILAGRPSMGKTALARGIAFGAARRNPDKLVPFFALEVDRDQLSKRNLSQVSYERGAGIPYHQMKSGRDLPPEDRAIMDALAKGLPQNLLIDDTAVLTLEHVRRRCMALRRRGPLALVVIDYLQIMDLPFWQGVNMTTAIGQVTKGLKQLSKQIGCGIILLSQLSRKCDERDNKRPMLSDLRDSGSIEQDASSVLFAYRDVYYLEREGPRKGTSPDEHAMAIAGAYRTMEVICAKSREGPIGTTKQIYIAECDVVENEGMHG